MAPSTGNLPDPTDFTLVLLGNGHFRRKLKKMEILYECEIISIGNGAHGQNKA